MNRTALIKIAMSSLVLGVTAVGCTMSGAGTRPMAAGSGHPEKAAAKAAALARKALAEHKYDAAVLKAEQAVAAMPRDAGYRALLGQAYLSAGRFASAEAGFSDALTLDPSNPNAVLSLALARIAQGNASGARTVLDDNRDLLTPSDRGLAIALAGDPAAAIEILEAAARTEGADAKTRQNLALTYALAGRWNEARIMAARDVAPGQITARLMQWAQFARPNAASDQVASLLGVTPALSDPGQPQLLALAPAAPAEPAQALAEAAPEPQPVTDEPTAAAETAVAMAEAPAPVPAALEAPAEVAPAIAGIVFLPRSEVVQPIPAATAPSVMLAATSTTRIPARISAPARSGNFVVQLGAYSRPAAAEAAWTRAVGRFGSLAGYAPTSAIVSVGRAGRVHRLAAAGFRTWGEASAMCAQIKASGGKCFARPARGDSPLRLATRGPQRVAAR